MTPSGPLTPTAEQRREAANLTAVIVDSCSATESLLHDILHIFATACPERIEALRDRAASQLEEAKAQGSRDLGHYENRLNLLDGALSSPVDPQPSAVVVSINDHWKRRG